MRGVNNCAGSGNYSKYSYIQARRPSPAFITTQTGWNSTLYSYNPNLCDAESHRSGSFENNILEYEWKSVGEDEKKEEKMKTILSSLFL